VRPLAALEKAGQAARDENASPATWTAGMSPRRHHGRTARTPSACRTAPRSPRRAWPPRTRRQRARGTRAPRRRKPGPPPRPARRTSPRRGRGAKRSRCRRCTGRDGIAGRDHADALAAADQITQTAARARRLLRHAGRADRREAAVGTPPGELRGLVAAHLAAYPAEDLGPHGGERPGPADCPRPGTADQRGAPALPPRRPASHRELTRAPGRPVQRQDPGPAARALVPESWTWHRPRMDLRLTIDVPTRRARVQKQPEHAESR
jgi:hypothetical protein